MIDRLYVTSLLAALSIVGVVWLDTAFKAFAKDVVDDVKPAITTKLRNVPGKSLSAVLVSYPPGGKSGPQHHAGSVFAYVVSGEIRSKNSATGPTRVYVAGESFFGLCSRIRGWNCCEKLVCGRSKSGRKPRARFTLPSVHKVGLGPCQGNPAGSLRSALTGTKPHPKHSNRRAKRTTKRAN